MVQPLVITSELKDSLLLTILKASPMLSCSFNLNDMASIEETNSEVIDGLLRYYESRGFMRIKRHIGNFVICNLEIIAFDFIQRGGFKFEDTIASSQLEKLTLEIESLYNAIPNEKYTRLMNGVSSIATALSLFKN